MPPTTKTKQPSVDSLATPATVATSATPSEVSTNLTPSSFRVKVPETLPSTALTSNFSMQDVYNKRADAEATQKVTAGINSSLDALSGRVGATATPFSNPEQFLNTMLLNRPISSAETQRDQLLARGAKNAEGLGTSINQAQDKATKEFGLPGLEQSLADTRTTIAERLKKYREDLRQFEVNAKERGVARAFVDDSKQKLTADATAELADLHIIEAAQQGNLTAAKDTIQSIIDNKRQAFEDENKAIEAEIARLQPQLDEQSKTRAAQLQIALDERKRNIETALANEKESRGYMAEAAANGADQGTLDAILRAKTPGEAALLAGPWVGKIQREQAQSSMYTNSLQQKKLLQELNPDNSSNNADLSAYGQQFADTGKLPSPAELKQSGLTIGQVTEFAKQAPKQDGAILSVNTGVKSSSLSTAQEDAIIALYDIKQKVTQLKELDNLRQQGLGSAAVGKIFGSADQQKYLDLRQEIVDLLSRARTGAALTASEEKFYADQLPGRIGQIGVIPGTNMGLLGSNSQNRIDNFETKIDGTLQTQLKTTGNVIQGYSRIEVPALGEQTVGSIVNIGDAQYRVLPDGTLTDII